MDVTTPFRLNSQRITQLLGDPGFYKACIAYAFMQDMALERYDQHAAEVLRTQSEGCGGCDDKSKALIDPALSTFIRHTVKLHDMDPAHLAPLASYLTGKLGYQPAKFVLRYKDKGRARQLIF